MKGSNDMPELRVGIVGAGGISPVHAAAWVALGASLQVFSHEGARELAGKYPMTIAGSLEELFSTVDIVDIVTPSSTHRAIALEAIGWGRHVICEKPLGSSIAEAQEIMTAAEESGVRVFPAHVVRYFPEYAAIQEQILAGRIGRLGILRLTRSAEAPRGKNWFFDENRGGGVVRDLMIHDLDQAAWMAGNVIEVFGMQNPPAVDGISATTVVAHAVLTHESGAITYIDAHWGPEGTPFRTAVAAFGDDGMLEHDSASNTTSRIELSTAGRPGYMPSTTGGVSPYQSELRDFAAAIADDSCARVSACDGVVAVGLAEAVMRSIAVGEPVRFDAAAVGASKAIAETTTVSETMAER